MNLFDTIMAKIYATEEAVVPIFIHDPVSQSIAGVVIAGETVFQQLVDSIITAKAAATASKTASAATPTPTVLPVTPITVASSPVVTAPVS